MPWDNDDCSIAECSISNLKVLDILYYALSPADNKWITWESYHALNRTQQHPIVKSKRTFLWERVTKSRIHEIRHKSSAIWHIITIHLNNLSVTHSLINETGVKNIGWNNIINFNLCFFKASVQKKELWTQSTKVSSSFSLQLRR